MHRRMMKQRFSIEDETIGSDADVVIAGEDEATVEESRNARRTGDSCLGPDITPDSPLIQSGVSRKPSLPSGAGVAISPPKPDEIVREGEEPRRNDVTPYTRKGAKTNVKTIKNEITSILPWSHFVSVIHFWSPFL